MFWEKLWSILQLDIVVLAVAIVSVVLWFYRWWKSRQGRHIVCRQPRGQFSHISLSGKARKWLEVNYVGDSQTKPLKIGTLSQVVIDIRNESDADVLNDVQLKFCMPDAKALTVWWDDAPEYLIEHSLFALSRDDRSPSEPASIVEVFLPSLKSFEKYREKFSLGILADGNLETVKMPPAGSRPGVAPDQIWTAKFVSYEESKRKSARRVAFVTVPTSLALILLFLLGTWYLASLFQPFLDQFASAYVFMGGFIFSGIVGLISSAVQRLVMAIQNKIVFLAQE
jgi:hypothetical protein